MPIQTIYKLPTCVNDLFSPAIGIWLKRDKDRFCSKTRHSGGKVLHGAVLECDTWTFSLFLMHQFPAPMIRFEEFRDGNL